MIPESSGATPYGIFLLADEYLRAAKSAVDQRGLSKGPTRLLAYHACELFLKTYLRSHGSLIAELRAFQHQLPEMASAAMRKGLKPKAGTLRRLKKIDDVNDYVRVRYIVHEDNSETLAGLAVELAERLRECVRLALNFNEFGQPEGRLWAGAMPADYPA